MVSVKLHPLLVKRARSKQERLEVPYEPGLRAVDVLLAEGFSEVDAEAVMVLRNDEQVDHDAQLADGDRVEFMVGIQGG